MLDNSVEDLTASDASGAGATTSERLAAVQKAERAELNSMAGESEALRILLQASAAAESLQVRFSELHQRRAEILADQKQLSRTSSFRRAGSGICHAGCSRSS